MLTRKIKRGTETEGTTWEKREEERELREGVRSDKHRELTVNVSQPDRTNVSSGYLFLYFLYLSLLQVNPVFQLSDSLQVKEKHC